MGRMPRLANRPRDISGPAEDRAQNGEPSPATEHTHARETGVEPVGGHQCQHAPDKTEEQSQNPSHAYALRGLTIPGYRDRAGPARAQLRSGGCSERLPPRTEDRALAKSVELRAGTCGVEESDKWVQGMVRR
jgi:hypothetical protein